MTRFKYWKSLLVLLILFLAFSYVLTLVRVSGRSMNPTLQEGQILMLQRLEPLLVNLGLSNYKRSDIVVLKPPKVLQTKKSRYIKRLIAVPGDTLSIRNNTVYLNALELTEPYVIQDSSRPENFPEVIVSKGEVVAFEGFALSELPDYLKTTLAMLEPLPQEVLEQSQRENVTYTGIIKLKEDFYFVLGDNRAFSASEDSRLFGTISKRDLLGPVISLGMKEIK
jgi:signal peptidase I